MLTPVAAQAPAAPASQLNAKEMTLDCAKLNGLVRMRAMQIKDAEQRSGPNAAGRAIHGVAAAVNGAPKRGMDPAADSAEDRAMLEAYKKRMAEKKCKPVVEYDPKPQPATKAK